MILEVDYDPDSTRFLIRVPGKMIVPAINEWPGWKRNPSGTYYAPAWASCVLLPSKERATEVRWTASASRKRDLLLANMGFARDSLTKGAQSMKPTGCPTERKPRPYQLAGVEAMRAMDWRVLLEDEMGLGKTSTALWALHDSHVARCIVLCPVSAKYNWENEFKETLGAQWPSVFVIDGTPKQRANQFAEVKEACNDSKDPAHVAIIINYDLLRYLTTEQWIYLKNFVGAGMLLCDESHYVKDRNAERTKLTLELSWAARFATCISGTPIRNMADDLFTQVEIIRPGTWSSYWDFAKRHLTIQLVKFGKREVRKIVGSKNIDQLNAIVNTFAIKRLKKDVGDLPPKVHTYPELELEGDMLSFYKKMKEFAKIELAKLIDDAAWPTHAAQITIWDPRAKTAVEAALRCEQIAQGFVGGIPEPLMEKLGDSLKLAEKIKGRPNELMLPSSPKIVWLIETIAQVLKQGGAPIILSRFNAPMFWLEMKFASLGVKSRVLHGDLSAAEKHLFVTDFQGGQFDVLLCQVKIAESWNATRCQDVIFLTRDWSPAMNSQGEDRAHRFGQKGTVNVQIPIVRNTIERLIHKKLLAKGVDAEQALRTVTIAELMENL
jgi:SWI/SNF-related matrix-associated actin-dependent regulator 1 of chromatin subfamily A